MDAHILKNCTTEKYQCNEQVGEATRIVSPVDLGQELNCDLFVGQWAHETLGHLEKDAAYKFARNQEIRLTTEAITQVIHEREMCATIK